MRQVWGVRAHLCDPQEGLVGLTCPATPDLRLFPDRARLMTFLMRGRHHEPTTRLRQQAGQLWSFAREVQPGDLVLLLGQAGRNVFVGEVSGDYFCTDGPGQEPLHQREVSWLTGPIRPLDMGADLAGALRSVALVRRIRSPLAECRLRELIGERTRRSEFDLGTFDDEAEDCLDNLAEAARKAIRAMLRSRFKGRQCEALVAAVLEAEGYYVEPGGPGPDGGLDLIAGSGPLGFGAERLAVQIKSGAKPVSGVELTAFEASMRRSGALTGLFVSLGGFSGLNARATARGGFQIRLWDEEALLDAVLKVYEKMPDDIRRDLPLKRVWIPASI